MTKNNLLTIVEKYKAGLKAYNISYYDIASQLNVHPNTIGNWLRGDKLTEKHMGDLLKAYETVYKTKVKKNKLNFDGILNRKDENNGK